jgi:hypothetical protein
MPYKGVFGDRLLYFPQISVLRRALSIVAALGKYLPAPARFPLPKSPKLCYDTEKCPSFSSGRRV